MFKIKQISVVVNFIFKTFYLHNSIMLYNNYYYSRVNFKRLSTIYCLKINKISIDKKLNKMFTNSRKVFIKIG